jgi:methylmalonyl-CoA mutase
MPESPASPPSPKSAEAEWRRLAEAGLKGAPFDKLVATSPEGIRVDPLYVASRTQDLAPRGEPGRFPFVRGGRSAGACAWLVAERFDAGRPVAELTEALGDGAQGVWLRSEGAVAADTVAAIAGAAGSHPVFCDAGAGAPQVFDALVRAGASAVSALYDPVGVFAASPATGAPEEAAFREAARLITAMPASVDGAMRHSLATSPALVHEAGGHAALEIGFALATLAELVRRLEPLGVRPERTLAGTAFLVAAGVDHLAAIAKLRALRLGYAKLAAAMGVTAAPPPFVIGHVSRRAQARADVPTNYLRATLEVFALAVGGADVVVSRAYDDVLAERSAIGRRIARTTQLVLRDESHLGEVADPAGGSYYLEATTDELARAGWEELRAIEKEGGVVASLAAGAFQARVRRAASELADQTRKRKSVIVGTSDFAAPGETLPPAASPPGAADPQALVPVRRAEPFEVVRDRAAGVRPVAVLVRLGEAAEWRPRDEFARRCFEAGGFEVRAVTWDDAASVVSGAPSAAFVLCGSDDRYAALAAGVVEALRRAGAAAVVLAGKPGALEPALRGAGLTAAIYVGCDVPAALASVLDAVSTGKSS